jgi:hypothetical protein
LETGNLAARTNLGGQMLGWRFHSITSKTGRPDLFRGVSAQHSLENIRWSQIRRRRFFITVNTTNGPASKIQDSSGCRFNDEFAGGFRVIRDSRIDRFLFSGLGQQYSFQFYKFTFNKYWGIGEKQILAYNLFVCGTGGQPPFYGKCIYGMSHELRGYPGGRYLDRCMFATQTEYRLELP